MINKMQSDPVVIDSGKSKLEQLQQFMYLHNFQGNYEAIGQSSFSPVDIDFMEAIWDKLIKNQKEREQKIYNILKISGVEKLNELFKEGGGQHEFLSTTTHQLIEAAVQKMAQEDLTGRATKAKKKELTEAVKDTLEEMLNENFSEDEQMKKALEQGLGAAVAKILANLLTNKKAPKKMEEYVERVSKALSAQFRGENLENTVGVALDRALQGLNKGKSKVIYTGKIHNSSKKQIKADHAVELNKQLTFGISEKNYLPDKSNNVEISLHSSGRLENFYRLMRNMRFSGGDSSEMQAIMNVIDKFDTPDFKYHVINQAAFLGEKNFAITPVGTTITNFVKKCLPLFIGNQFKIMGDDFDVDFFNINGSFVPVSVILTNVKNGTGYAEPRVNIYNNYEVPWTKMRDEKLSQPLEENNYYGEQVLEIGGKYGKNLYRQINVGTIHLKLALAKL